MTEDEAKAAVFAFSFFKDGDTFVNPAAEYNMGVCMVHGKGTSKDEENGRFLILSSELKAKIEPGSKGRAKIQRIFQSHGLEACPMALFLSGNLAFSEGNPHKAVEMWKKGSAEAAKQKDTKWRKLPSNACIITGDISPTSLFR